MTSGNGPRSTTRATRAGLLYALWAVIWIVASDVVLSRTGLDGPIWPIGKGLLFVAFTAAVLRQVVLRHERDVRDADARARDEVRDLLAQTTDLMYVVDLDGRWLMINGAMGRLLGCEPDDAVGRHRSEFMDTDTAEQHRANDLAVIAADAPLVAFETHAVGGEVLHYRSTKFPIRDGSGATHAVGGLSVDVTVESKLRRELDEAAAAFDLTFQGNPNPMLVIDIEDLTIADVNPAAVRLYGWSSSEFIGMPATDIRPSSERQRFIDHMSNRYSHDDAGQWRHTTKSGHQIDVEISSVTITYNGRQAALALIRDVSAEAHRRRTDRLLIELDAAAETSSPDDLLAIAMRELCDLTQSTSVTIEPVSSPDWTRAEEGHEPEPDGSLAVPLDLPTGDTEEREPLRHEVVVLTGKPGGYDEQDKASVESTVGGLRRLVARQHLVAALTQAGEQRAATIEGITKAVSAMVEMRDPYTAGHQQRVGDLAAELGLILGLEDDQIDGLRLGGYLHDVGKMGVPSDILTKTGPLSPIERLVIQQHSEFGSSILEPVPFPWPIAAMAGQHHERLDGSGYPNGLAGNDILLEARIIAVADVFDAMTSARPYRSSCTTEQALEELTAGAGSAFDPDVVAAIVRHCSPSAS